jgi:23S rRNA pseudouridine1911/1915/1917 synthase
MTSQCDFTFQVEPSLGGLRLDAAVSMLLSHCSRSFATQLIRNGHILVDGKQRKSAYRVSPGQTIVAVVPEPERIAFAPEPIPIDVIYEDDTIIVVNKQPGLVVHPAPGHYTGTLVNALLHHAPQIGTISGQLRPGIVHRLDKDTSGTLVVAKSSEAHLHLSQQFKERTVRKTYRALVHGRVKSDSGSMEMAIGRHPVDRKKMSVKSRTGKAASTLWKVEARYSADCTLLRITLKTGRTHQIRVHCSAIYHPVVGDSLYGRKKGWGHLKAGGITHLVKRQMLHAWKLEIDHPTTGERMLFKSDPPGDMKALLMDLEGISESK